MAINDWRVEYIENNTYEGEPFFDIWQKFHFMKNKLSTCTTKQIEIENKWLHDITEVCDIQIFILTRTYTWAFFGTDTALLPT